MGIGVLTLMVAVRIGTWRREEVNRAPPSPRQAAWGPPAGSHLGEFISAAKLRNSTVGVDDSSLKGGLT